MPNPTSSQLAKLQGVKAKRKPFVRPRYDAPVSDAPIDVTVRLTMRLVNELNGSRENIYVVAKRRKDHRISAGKAVSSARGFARSPDARYIVTLTRIITSRGKEFDADDNLRAAFKSTKDGVADALEINDGGNRVEWRYEQKRGDEFAVEIRVWTMPTLKQAFQNIYDAGGHAWDKVEDVAAFIKEIRGED